MTRSAVYGSPAWRRWKHDHHWATVPSDPLGSGNTALIAALAVTPIAFHDVRKNLVLSGSNVTSLGDVSGVGTYGPSFTTAGTAPTWDGTVIKTNGTGILITSSAVTGLDLSTPLTLAIIADIAGTGTGTAAGTVGAAANGSPKWFAPLLAAGPVLKTTTSTNGAGAASTAASGTGNIRLAIYTVNVAGTDAVTIEVPNTAKASSGTITALASGNQLIAIGGTTSAGALAAVRFRTLIAWSGGYTTGQRDTLKTYATTYHGMVNA